MDKRPFKSISLSNCFKTRKKPQFRHEPAFSDLAHVKEQVLHTSMGVHDNFSALAGFAMPMLCWSTNAMDKTFGDLVKLQSTLGCYFYLLVLVPGVCPHPCPQIKLVF